MYDIEKNMQFFRANTCKPFPFDNPGKRRKQQIRNFLIEFILLGRVPVILKKKNMAILFKKLDHYVTYIKLDYIKLAVIVIIILVPRNTIILNIIRRFNNFLTIFQIYLSLNCLTTRYETIVEITKLEIRWQLTITKFRCQLLLPEELNLKIR